MRIALVHDDLVQWGGAERALSGLTEIYPEAPVYTSVYDSGNNILKKQFEGKKIITSFLQKIPGWRSLYKTLLPLYGLAFEQFNFDGYDLVISSTTRFAKAIITKPATIHICYCHTPPRFLWNFYGSSKNKHLDLLLSKLRTYDLAVSNRPDYYLAGSKNARDRIKKVYGLPSTVVYPFIDLARFKRIESFDGGYFVVISRFSKYKKIDLAIKACTDLKLPLKVIGDGWEAGEVKWVEFLGSLDDEKVAQVMAGCKALIIAGIEDFGLTSLEAQALGKPVVAFAQGGVLETVILGKTGILFDKQTEDSLKEALNKLELVNINVKDCLINARNFSKEKFIKNFQATVASLLYTN